jgi:5-methylcytosine-specific restriction endonuclease McrA
MCPCQAKRKAEHDAKRPSAAARGYDGKWRAGSKAFLALPQNRYCACGCGRLANVVDHIVPHRGDHRLFWDRRNWQPMFKRCHDSKKQSMEKQQCRSAD